MDAKTTLMKVGLIVVGLVLAKQVAIQVNKQRAGTFFV